MTRQEKINTLLNVNSALDKAKTERDALLQEEQAAFDATKQQVETAIEQLKAQITKVEDFSDGIISQHITKVKQIHDQYDSDILNIKARLENLASQIQPTDEVEVVPEETEPISG